MHTVEFLPDPDKVRITIDTRDPDRCLYTQSDRGAPYLRYYYDQILGIPGVDYIAVRPDSLTLTKERVYQWESILEILEDHLEGMKSQWEPVIDNAMRIIICPPEVFY